ncbi:hypothetical protein JOD43_001645 [Pullulanibacillus pueri]|nr:hypothetical protein [Pullulanibacillus pueri]
MRKGKERTFLNFGILLLICVSSNSFQFDGYTINWGFLMLIFCCAFPLKELSVSSLIYHIFSVMIIGMSYVLLHIYLLFDPAILLIIHPWMVVFPLLFITHFLVRSLPMRLYTTILGMGVGECLQTLVFQSFDQTFGDTSSLDAIALATGLTILFGLIGRLVNKMRVLYERQFPKRLSK